MLNGCANTGPGCDVHARVEQRHLCAGKRRQAHDLRGNVTSVKMQWNIAACKRSAI